MKMKNGTDRFTSTSWFWRNAARRRIVGRIRRGAGKITADGLRNRRCVSNHEQEQSASQPRSESLHRGKALVVIRLRNNQLERALFSSFAEKCGEENDEEHERSDRHNSSTDTAEHFGIGPIGMIEMRLRVGV